MVTKVRYINVLGLRAFPMRNMACSNLSMRKKGRTSGKNNLYYKLFYILDEKKKKKKSGGPKIN